MIAITTSSSTKVNPSWTAFGFETFGFETFGFETFGFESGAVATARDFMIRLVLKIGAVQVF